MAVRQENRGKAADRRRGRPLLAGALAGRTDRLRAARQPSGSHRRHRRTETPVGAPADWRKLLGVLPDETVIGFVEDEPFPRPALLSRDGERTDLPPPADDAERKQIGVLLQEARGYADGARLEVRDSERGGRGRDVFLIEGARERNLSDCGDDLCGQPARSMDGATFFYIRGARP